MSDDSNVWKLNRIEFEYTGHETVPKDVTHVRFHSSVIEVAGYEYDDYEPIDHGYAFLGCKKLKEVVLNEGLLKIGKYAFSGCTSLKRIEFPSSLVEIGELAFCDCESLERIELPPTLTEIGKYVFKECGLKEVVLYEGLNKIERGLFFGCALLSIRIPSTVMCIGTCSFKHCSHLKKVEFTEGLRKIGNGTFSYCPSLGKCTLPSTLTQIGENAFLSCHNLGDIVLNEGLQKIGDCAFNSCLVLETITIPSTVTEIGNFAFANCTCLNDVLIHDRIQKIGPKAFLQCMGLRRFIFPTISTRLATITPAGRSRVEHKIDNEVSLLERRGNSNGGSEVLIYAEALIRSGIFGADIGNFKWDQVKERLDKIVRLIVCHEIKDATTLFELALWKCKLDQEDGINPIDRNACRIDVPGPVKDSILQYLCSKEDFGI